MDLAQGIRKHGFRKWYERQLLQSHANLALTFLCSAGAFASVEGAVRFRSWSDQLTNGAALLLSAGIGIWALRRYLRLLTHAEMVAGQADCPACQTYGRLDVERSEANVPGVAVSCRQCGHRWRIMD
jgi:Zn ribbon nucleic-acid-binding protein